MRRFTALTTLAIVILACDNSEAANRRVRVNSNPVMNGGTVSNDQSANPLSRLIELERRKNAALRQMFFGR